MPDETCRTTPTILNWVNDPTDERAWTAFAERYRARIMAWCGRSGLKQEESEDVTQDILLRIRNKISKYKPERGRFRSWLKALTHNACMDYFRSEVPRRIRSLEGDVAEDLESTLDDQARTELLHVALAELEPTVATRDWAIFIGRVFQALPADELARQHGTTEVAVHQIKYRVQKALKAKLLDLDENDGDLDLAHE
jgi:RNA polymerase sigma-70 factor (ECF subfamily)